MGISLKQALVFVPQDPNWAGKVFIGGLLLFCPTFAYVFPGIRRMIFDPINYYLLALFIIFTVVLSLAVCGYFFKAIHNRIVHDKEMLPSWKNISYYIFVGFKAYAGGFVFSIPFFIAFAILFSLAPMTLNKELIPFIIVASVIHVIYTAFYVMLALKFARDFKMQSFFQVRKAFSLIKENIVNYVILVLYCLLLGLINLVVNSILINGQIFALLIPFVNFYVYLAYTDLFAQFELNKNEEKCNETECLI